MILSRRRLFVAGAALLAAPSIVRVASLMPVSVTCALSSMSLEEWNGLYLRPQIRALAAAIDADVTRLYNRDFEYFKGAEWLEANSVALDQIA